MLIIEIQETSDGSAVFDSSINIEVVGFDLLIPFTIIQSLNRSINRLSALSSLHHRDNTKSSKQYRYHNYHNRNPYKIPVAVGQERVVKELDSVIPGFHSRKFKFVIYGGVIGIISDLTSVHTMTRYLQKNHIENRIIYCINGRLKKINFYLKLKKITMIKKKKNQKIKKIKKR